jgi:hypothetical protein
MTTEEAEYLKPGTKLIFVRHGGCLSYDKGRVFTFKSFHPSDHKYDEYRYIQLKECHDFGNITSNADVRTMELYDSEIHKGVEVTQEILKK